MKKRQNKSMKNRKSFLSLFLLLLSLLSLPFIYTAAQTLTQYLSSAAGTKANIIVDTSIPIEPISQAWRSFAQGGEETKNMIAPIVPEVRNLSPRYIRIDHMFDHHMDISRSNGGLKLNFTRLDAIVNSIRATGALPFFSLSYMPSALATGDTISAPRSWDDWAFLVQKTVEHYSGKDGMNLENIYYEVWNEPDLFGRWSYSGNKNYLTLYDYSVRGAQNAQNVNTFKIGGPATTQLYKPWIVAFADYVTANNIRLDFFSWHRYNKDPIQFKTDIADVTSWLFPYATLLATPRIISEWGFDSDINPGYDGNLAAAHAIATLRQTVNGYDHLFAFELADGPDPSGKKFWGRWGLITYPGTGKTLKPRYQAFQLFSQLTGIPVLLKGEGTWVTGLATKDGETIKILLVNYDYNGRNSETVPLTIKNITPATYTIVTTRLGQNPVVSTTTIADNKYVTSVLLKANIVVLIEMTPQPATPSGN